MLGIVSEFFSTKGFMPHGMCLLWKPSVLWTLVFSNILIAISYLLIPAILLTVYVKRKDVKYTWIFLLFAAFILLCGTTHALHVVTYWNPIYGAQGVVDALTGGVSFLTALVLWRLVPDLLKLPTPTAFKLSEKKYKTLVESVQHGICTFGTNYKLNYVNKMGCLILDQSKENLLGRDVRELFKQVNFSLRISAKAINRECVLQTQKKQKLIHYSLTQLALSEDGNQYLFSFNDITIFKNISDWSHSSDLLANAKLTRSRLLESQKLESLGQLASGIAHDFNNTLAVIEGSIDISSDLANPDETVLHHQLAIAKKAVKNSATLIKQLLMFSRNENEQYEKKPLNINAILEQIATFQETILGSNINLTIDSKKDLWEINANETQLIQVFTNFLINARDAISGAGNICITTKNVVIEDNHHGNTQVLKPGSYVKLTISDTGMGMPKETIKNIFKPFFSTKPAGKGTGLGLSVIYGIIISYGGDIFVDSEINQGTTFTVYFPKASTTHQGDLNTNEVLNSENANTHSLEGKNILVVDDDEDLLEIFTIYLSSNGVKVYTATNGLEALTAFKKHKDTLHLIVLDTKMPKLDGISAYEKIRKISSELPTLFISGHDDNSKLSKIMKTDPYSTWLSKPFTKADFLRSASFLIMKLHNK